MSSWNLQEIHLRDPVSIAGNEARYFKVGERKSGGMTVRDIVLYPAVGVVRLTMSISPSKAAPNPPKHVRWVAWAGASAVPSPEADVLLVGLTPVLDPVVAPAQAIPPPPFPVFVPEIPVIPATPSEPVANAAPPESAAPIVEVDIPGADEDEDEEDEPAGSGARVIFDKPAKRKPGRPAKHSRR